ncbi:MAG: hypothetical protein AAGC70_01685 [Pseudomonadota bacterium]
MSYRLKDFGSFHVGGRRVETSDLPKRFLSYTPAAAEMELDPNGVYWIEQAYVQFFVPEHHGDRLPIVFLHGGGLTGASWETTPDSRPGWLNHFLEFGYPCYVVDQPERGRAGFSVLPDTLDGDAISRPLEEAWTRFRFGELDGFATRTPYPGCDFPVEYLDAFGRQFVPRWTTTRAMHLAGFRDVVAHIGNCIVICHSQGGDAAHVVASERNDLVQAVVALEPSAFSPDLSDTQLSGQRYLYVFGDYIDRSPFWVDLQQKAIANAEALKAAGAEVTWLDLPTAGLAGTSHMIMMDKSSAQSAQMVRRWLAGG